jgi:transcriptional regulator with XRE-family HTH domain
VSAESGDEPQWLRHDPLKRFAKNIREARAALDLSQEAVAFAADMNPSQYSRIERGKVEPGVRTSARVARALSVPVAQLYEGVEWMPPPWLGPAERRPRRPWIRRSCDDDA